MCGCRISVPSLRVCVVCLNEWVRDAMRVTWRCRGSRDWTRSRIRYRLAVAPMHEPCVSHLGAASAVRPDRPAGHCAMWRQISVLMHDLMTWAASVSVLEHVKRVLDAFQTVCYCPQATSIAPSRDASSARRGALAPAPIAVALALDPSFVGSLVPRRAVSALPPSPPLPALF